MTIELAACPVSKEYLCLLNGPQDTTVPLTQHRHTGLAPKGHTNPVSRKSLKPLDSSVTAPGVTLPPASMQSGIRRNDREVLSIFMFLIPTNTLFPNDCAK